VKVFLTYCKTSAYFIFSEKEVGIEKEDIERMKEGV
jgi:hypothetical protein